MFGLLPIPKIIEEHNGNLVSFDTISINTDKIQNAEYNIKELFKRKFWNFPDLLDTTDQSKKVIINLHELLPEHKNIDNINLYMQQGYALRITTESIDIYSKSLQGLSNSLSTLKQLFIKKNIKKISISCCYIIDWPSIEVRSISNSFAWYAGYGRIGFDMQLWGYEEWVEYLNICSDFKINQFNMCMYGYWPFELPEYPETELKNYEMPIWNRESGNWIQINYSHPNIKKEYLTQLITYGHSIGVDFFAYIGLNSYNGGYASEHKASRMKFPESNEYINDFDSLCLNQPETVNYLETAVRKIVQLGFDGIDFEESEESNWFCSCDKCTSMFGGTAVGPAELKHRANYELLKKMHAVIKDENPNCIVGLRAWREPPLEKDPEYIKSMVSNIPDDVVLFWAPGLYTGEDEFTKWVNAFGPERIWGRDTESNAVSSCFGRLIRIFRSNGLRCKDENNDQYLEEDIKQYIGSVKMGVKGTNGYMFEWFGFFLHLFAHSFYSWGSTMDSNDFYHYSLNSVFGQENGGLLYDCLMNSLTIHESQLSIFPTEFPFARNTVSKEDVPLIMKAKENWKKIYDGYQKILSDVSKDHQLSVYSKHIDKLLVSHIRNGIMYDLVLASISFDNAEKQEERNKYLKEMYLLNEKGFEITRNNYFDVCPVSKTGIKSCMIPYHELKRVISNELFPDETDLDPIYLGVEALGWLWL